MSSTTIDILLVEDDLGDADILCELLDMAGCCYFQVTQCRRLSEALDYLLHTPIDVVLLDLSLPDSHGLATVNTMYSQVPIPIVILSGLEDESLAVEAVQTGAQDYLVKGQVGSDELVRAIRYAIERSKNVQLLNEKEQQLQKVNEELEYRVVERTAELQHANQQLRGLEAELRQALIQEKEFSELKSRIITTISHEYRTPLTTIASSAELLEYYRHTWDDSKQLKHLHRIQKSVKHMTALVNDVLFLTKAEFEKLEFQPELLDIVPFFQDIFDELQLTAKENYHFLFTHQVNCKQTYLDVKLLRQILTNLISNAIKYSPEGGSITLELSCEENTLTFKVSDQGIGIPEDERQNLFESFHRASNVGTIPGTGLGLSIVKKCVELHNGTIEVESNIGVGTTFIICLPRYSQKKGQAEIQRIIIDQDSHLGTSIQQDNN